MNKVQRLTVRCRTVSVWLFEVVGSQYKIIVMKI
nr:MAG TPA: hypothetical protein [Caudoviricetes sp.]